MLIWMPIVAACAVAVLAQPTRLIARAERPLFEPTTPWEKVGQVPNVVFVETLVMEPTRWLFYYGAAYTRIGVSAVAR